MMEFIEIIQEQIWVSLVIVVIIGLLSFFVGKMAEKADPEKKAPVLLAIFEMIVGIINNFVKDSIGKKRWRSLAPYFLTLALYLLFANLAGLSGFLPPTSSWNVTLALALITFFIIHFVGIKSKGLKKYIKGYFEPLPFLFPVNIIGEFAFPLALSLRLFGNILSGVVMGKLIYGLGGWAAVPAMPAFHLIFDIFFGVIQVVVFVLLSVIFVGQKVDESEFIENDESAKALEGGI